MWKTDFDIHHEIQNTYIPAITAGQHLPPVKQNTKVQGMGQMGQDPKNPLGQSQSYQDKLVQWGLESQPLPIMLCAHSADSCRTGGLGVRSSVQVSRVKVKKSFHSGTETGTFSP